MTTRTKQKLTVNLSPEIVEILKELADRNGTTMTDEIKKAIADRKYFIDKIDAGNEILLEHEDRDDSVTRTLVDLR